jgi:hypothetical protein
MTQKSHADAAPSAASSWIACPAFVTKTRGMERRSTIYAREGTAAHEVAATLLTTGEAPKSVTVEDDVFVVDDDMMDALEPYLRFVRETTTRTDFTNIETKVSISGLPEPVHGTADMIALARWEKTLDIADLKFGRGVPVEASNNAQMRVYALGALEALGPFEDVARVRMTIVQPRIEDGDVIKSETISIDELAAWKNDVFMPAVSRIAAGDTTEHAGVHCRWCPRAHECDELQALVGKKAMVAFNQAPPLASTISDDDLARIYDYSKLILAWVSRVEEEIRDRLDKGKTIPGYHLVPKRAMRQWIDEDAALHYLTRKLTLPIIDITKLVSPAAVERVMKTHKIKDAAVEELWKKESSGSTIAPIGGRAGVPASRDASLIFEKI